MENELSGKIIGIAIDIHKNIGPGLMENVYKECLFHKLRKAGLHIQKEKAVPFMLDEISLDCGYRIDLVVNNLVAIEVKSVETFHDLHFAQLLTYIRLGNYPLGLLINFNVMYLKNGVKRMINTPRR
jgi:GxxExxY protein